MKISLISEGVARMRFVRLTWNCPGLKSDFSVFDTHNRFLRILKPGKSCLHRFLTEYNFCTCNESDFLVFDTHNRYPIN